MLTLTTIIIPVILLITGSLKLFGTINVPQDGLFGSAVLTFTVVLFEYLLAFRLLSRRNMNFTVPITGLFFAAGAIYNGFLLYTGVPTCGCLGATEVSPIYMLIFDVILAATLLLSKKIEVEPTKTDVFDILSLASIIIISSTIGLFVFNDNPKEVLDRFKGENLIVANYINNGTKNIGDRSELDVKVKNVSDKKITISGYNASCNAAMKNALPITIEPNSEVNLQFIINHKKTGKSKTLFGLFFADDLKTKTKIIKTITDVKDKK